MPIFVENSTDQERIRHYESILKSCESLSDDDVIAHIEKFLEDYPDFALAHNDLGVLYYRIGNKLQTLGHYQKAINLDSSNPTYVKNLASFYFVEMHWTDEAVRMLTEILKCNQDDTEILGSLGIINASLNLSDQARYYFEKIIALEPSNREARNALEALPDAKREPSIKLQAPIATEPPSRKDSEIKHILEDLREFISRIDDRKDPAFLNPQNLSNQDSRDFHGTGGMAFKGDPPLVSVIIPLFNGHALTRACLRSFAETTPSHRYELILVDNASSDQTCSLLESLPADIRIIRNEKNLGFAAACNQGARLSSGKYLLFLNNDTELEREWLEPLIETAEKDPSIAAVGSKLLFPDGTIQHAGVVIVEDHKHHDLLLARHVFHGQPADMPQANFQKEYQALTAACLLVRKAAFEAVEGFDEGYWNGYEDVDLCFKLREKNWRLLYQPASQLVHHESKSGSERFRMVHHNIRRLHDKWLGKVTPDIIIDEDGEARLATDRHSAQRKTADSLPSPQNQKAVMYEGGLTSIVILTFNQIEFTKNCLESIRRHTPEPHELIFVDNGSADGTVSWLKTQAEKTGNIRVIENKSNLGFARGCNQGIAASRGEFIMLLNNDVIVTDAWLGGMVDCLQRERHAGIAGPMTNNISGTQKVPDAPGDNLSEISGFAETFRNSNRHRRIPQRRIVGFCMLFRRELADAIGLLDESFGSGNFEDDDFCLRAELAGFRNVIAGDVFIHHAGSATFKGNNIDVADAMTGNMKIFNDKWSRPATDEKAAAQIVTLKTLEKADTQYQRGEIDRAIETLLQEGIRNASKEKRFYYALAEYFIDQERFKDALDTMLEFPERCDEARKSALQARALAGLNRFDEAEALARSALEADRSNTQAHTLLGRIAYDKGMRDQAVSHFEEAISADPGYGEPYTCLGLIALQEGNPSQSADLLEKGFTLSPLSAESATNYHSVVAGLGELDRAECKFREIRRFYPQHRTIHFLLIDLLIRQGKTMPALSEIEKACLVFGITDGMLAAGLELRRTTGPLAIQGEKLSSDTSVSLCMIVKNEEDNLPRCLSSLKPVVDEIIVADTGSSDRSREVAELYGARVLEHAWNADFSAARNAGLKEANGNWILVMDADEALSPLDHGRFRRMIEDSSGSCIAFDMVTRNYLSKINVENWHDNDGLYHDQEAGAGWTPSSKVRVFPNGKNILFHNAIHEMVDRSLSENHIAVSKTAIPVHHYGYLDQKRQDRKGEHYYQLGRKKLAESGEDDIKALAELAIQAGGIGRYEEALELWHKVIAINPSLDLAYFNMGFVYLQMGMFTESRDASAKAMRIKRRYYEAANNYAMAELCLGNVDEAVRAVNDTLAEKPDYPNAQAMLAVVRMCGGNKAEGLNLLKELSLRGVVFTEFLNETASKLKMAGKDDYVQNLLDTVIGGGHGNGETFRLRQAS